MNDAISVFYYVFNKIYNFLFNQAIISEGVSIGWIFVAVVIFGLIISTVLNIPEGLHYGNYTESVKNEFGKTVWQNDKHGFNRGNSTRRLQR